MYATSNSQCLQTSKPMPIRTSAFEITGTRVMVALSCAYYVVGTMGLLTPEAVEQRSATSTWGVNYEHNKTSTNREAQAARKIQPTSAEDISRIRDVLKPTVLELANLFRVSRQAVYDWQAGAQPSTQVAGKLASLAHAAEVFVASGITVNTQTLRRRVAGGGTLLDEVLNGGNAVHVAQSFVQTLKREALQQQQLSQRLAGRKGPPMKISDYGIPHLSDIT